MIIGITGRAGSGKSTVADILVRKHGYVSLAFADPLKRICREVFDFTDEQLWGPSSARNKPDLRYPRGDGSWLSPRHALQQLGTEWGRACYPDVWVDYTLRVATLLLDNPTIEYNPTTWPEWAGKHSPTHGVVISDVRFPNEIHRLRASGAHIIKTTYDSGQNIGSNHESERHFDSLEVDATISPDVDLDTLPDLVTMILKDFR